MIGTAKSENEMTASAVHNCHDSYKNVWLQLPETLTKNISTSTQFQIMIRIDQPYCNNYEIICQDW